MLSMQLLYVDRELKGKRMFCLVERAIFAQETCALNMCSFAYEYCFSRRKKSRKPLSRHARTSMKRQEKSRTFCSFAECFERPWEVCGTASKFQTTISLDTICKNRLV